MRQRAERAASLAGLLWLLMLAGCGNGPGSSDLSGRACLARLDEGRVAYRPVDAVNGPQSWCRIDTAVRVTRIAAGLDKPATMSCALAARLDRFDREVVQPLARRELGQRVVRTNHLGSFSCRSRNGRGDRLSQHGLGRAIDIGGFRLADGSTVSIAHDWAGEGKKRQFLRYLARRACEHFSVVLTPDSDADHHDHIHLDIGPDRKCPI
jgi:hypothetical protein